MKAISIFLSITLFIISNNSASAAGLITALDVSEGVVVFAVNDAKTAASPACMASNYADKWALKLNTETGEATYSLLMTAIAMGLAINVESAGDCQAKDGYERAARVWLQPAP